jgi:hypothetical protein
MIFPSSTSLERQVIRGQTESPTKTFSQVYPFNQGNLTKVTKTLSSGTVPIFRASVLAEESTVVQFLGVDELGNVFVITRPKVNIEDPAYPFYLASASDIIGKSVPVRLPAADYFATFTSLIPTEDVTLLSLIHAEEMPDTVPGPGTADDQAAPCFARLGYGNDGDETGNTIPQIANFSKLLPVPKGVILPSGPWLATEAKPELADVFPAFETWRRAIVYGIQHNAGWSVTQGGPLFDLASIREGQFNNDVADSVTTQLTMIPVTSPFFEQVDNTILEMSKEYWSYLGGLLPPLAVPPQEGVNPMPPQQNQLNPGHLLELVAGLNQSLRPASEKESTLTQDDIVQRFRLLFACLVPNQEPGGEPTVALGTLSPDFLKFLHTTKLSTAQRDLKEILDKAFNEAGTSDHRLDANANFDPNIVDKVLTSSFREFTFLQDSMNIASDRIKYTINLSVFAEPARKSDTFTNRIYQDQTAASQEAVGEESTKMARKNNELYIDGNLSTVKNIKTLLCNLRIFCKAICPDFESSELWKAIAPNERTLHSQSGGNFAASAGSNNPQVALNLLNDLQDIANQFVRIANTGEYRRASANKEPISPKAYQLANTLGQEITTALFSDVQRNHLGKYMSPPPCANAFAHMRNFLARGGNQQSDNMRRGQPNNNMPRGPAANPGAQRNPPRANNPMPAGDQPSLRTWGFLKWSGSGPLPNCPVRVKLPMMDRAERFCLRFCTQGVSCTYGARCKFAHPQGFQQIPNTATKDELANFVRATPGLAFIQGQGPPGTN